MNLKNLLIFYLLYLPFAPLLNKYFTYSVASSSLWITVIPFLTFAVIFLAKLNTFRIKEFNFFFLLIIIFVIVMTGQLMFFTNSIPPKFSYYFYLFYPIFFLVSLRNVKFTANDLKVINIILFTHIIFGSITGLLYIFGFETIQVAGEENLEFVISRFTGISGGANVYSNLMFTFYLLLVLLNKKNLFIVLLSSIILWPILISSGSRTPLVLFLITILFISTYKISIKSFFLSIIVIIIIILIFSSSIDQGLNNPFIRLSTLLDNDTGGRVEKLSLAIEVLFSSITSLIFGVQKDLLSNGIITISDNSLTLVLTSFGIIFSSLWIVFCLFISRIKFKFIKNRTLIFYMFNMFLIFVLNNSILWIVWVYCSIFGLHLIHRAENTLELN